MIEDTHYIERIQWVIVAVFNGDVLHEARFEVGDSFYQQPGIAASDTFSLKPPEQALQAASHHDNIAPGQPDIEPAPEEKHADQK